MGPIKGKEKQLLIECVEEKTMRDRLRSQEIMGQAKIKLDANKQVSTLLQKTSQRRV
jgi:hypothetical protein